MDQPSISLTRQQDFIGSREIREFFMRGSRRDRGGKERKRKNKKKETETKQLSKRRERKKEGRKERVGNKAKEKKETGM